MSLLEIKDLRLSYDGKLEVLKGMDLSVEEGELVGVIGKSGSGKSSLLRCINLLVRPKAHTLRFDGVDILTLSPSELRKLRRKIGFVFQDYNLIDPETVLENVLSARLGYLSFFETLLGLYSEMDYKRADKAIERVGLGEKKFERAKDLSGGQKQRVAIAKTLCQDASLVLADEPVSSLDPQTTIQIMDYFKRIHDIKGKTMIINLHNVELAQKYCGRIVAIRDGRIAYDGEPGGLNDRIIQEIYK